MKKLFLFVLTVSLLLANTAMADSIAGKFGVTARGGASYIANSELTAEAAYDLDANKDIEADTGWTIGGGFMYGINDNLAVTFDINYLQTEVEISEDGGPGRATFGALQTVDFSFGAQWRFMPQSRFVPYVGAGVDVLWNNMDI
ncbi:MAG: OmpW family outer membrane protein [Smithella sp.]|jgi:outer membrane protein W